MSTRTSIRPRDLTPAQRVLLRYEDRGFVAIKGDLDRGIAWQLVKGGMLKHRHGLIYEVTPVGAIVVERLREEDAARDDD